MPLTSLFVFPVKKIEVRERNKKWKITWSYGVINFCMILKWWIRNKTNLSYKNLEKVNRYWENENKGAQDPEVNFRSFKKIERGLTETNSRAAPNLSLMKSFLFIPPILSKSLDFIYYW